MAKGLLSRARLAAAAFGAAGLLVLPAAWLFFRAESSRFAATLRADAAVRLDEVRLALEGALTSRMTLLRALAAFAASRPTLSDQDFAVFAAQLSSQTPGLRSLQLARDSVVSHVYPGSANPGILGLRLPGGLPADQEPAFSRALASGEPVVDGPVNLIQGGQGLIGRMPVLLPGDPQAPPLLWGMASIVIDADAFFDLAARVAANNDLRLAIRATSAPTPELRLIFGDAALTTRQPVEITLPVPGGAWHLSAIPDAGWTAMPLSPGLLAASGCVWLALGAALFLGLAWPARLGEAVRRATADLDAAKIGLESTVAARTAELTAANAALRRSEALYRTFIDATADIVFLKDPDFRFIVANRTLADFLGTTPEALVGLDDFAVMEPQLAASCHESDVATRDGRQITVQMELLGDKAYEVRKFPVDLGQGRPGVGGYIRDISDRTAAEQALRRSEEALRALMDNAPVGIFTSTPQGRYVKANGYLARMYGYDSPAELLERVPDIQHAMYIDPAERDALLARLEEQNFLSNCEIRRRTRSGDVIWVSLSIRAVRDASGRITHLEGFCTDITTRKQAEATLAAQERQLRSIFENSPLGLASIAPSGVIRDSNARFLDILGLAPEQAMGTHIPSRLPDFAREALGRALAGEPAVAEGPCRTEHNGRHAYVRISFNPVEPGRSAAGVIASVEDFTAKRAREQELRLLRAAVERSPASIVITDATGDIEYVNPHFAELTGYAPAEALGRNPRLLKSGFHDEAFYRDMWDTILDGRIWRGEFCNRRKDGSLYWENASISPIPGVNGRITHFVAVKEDITAQKDREARLRRVMSEFEAIFNASSVGIVHLGPDDRVVRVNRRFAELFETAPETLAGRPLLAEARAADPRLEAFFHSALADAAAGGNVHAEQRFRSPSGLPFWCTVHGRRIAPESPAAGSLWIFDDISARKELEAVREDVERIMRHDLKAPLNSLINLPELMPVVGPVTVEQQELLDEMTQAAGLMLDQINLSLDLYKMETGNYAPDLQSVDLGHVMTNVAEMLAKTAQTRGVSVTLRTPRQPVFARANALLCQTVATNLLKNAIEAEPAGNAVTAELAVEDGRAVLRIANPTPVPAEMVPVFFDKYATSGKNGGNGLGTYSARLMTQSMGGDIALDTAPETGTVVTVRLPLVTREEQEEEDGLPPFA